MFVTGLDVADDEWIFALVGEVRVIDIGDGGGLGASFRQQPRVVAIFVTAVDTKPSDGDDFRHAISP